MEKYGVYQYNITFLIERWGIKRQSVQWYIDRYKDEINAEQVHIKKIGKEWRLDAKAVNIFDGIVGYVGDSVAVFEYESAETTRIKELEQALAETEAENARQKEWLDSQALVAKKQLALLEAHETKIKELTDNNTKLQQLTSKADKEREDHISKIQDLEDESKANLERAMEAEATVAKFENMVFLDRLKFLVGIKE